MRGLRRGVVALVAVAFVVVVPPAVAGGGNSDAAHACQHGGWKTLTTSTGTPFSNQGDCVSYAAHGGTFGSTGGGGGGGSGGGGGAA